MNGELRPMGIGEILDAAMKLFLRHWRPLVLSVVGLILPVQVVSALITASIAPERFDWTTSESGVEEGEEAAFLAGQAAILLLTLVSVLLATAVCFKAVADAYLGVEPDWRRSLRFALRRLGGLLGVSVIGGLAILVGFLAFIVPGIWLTVAFSVAVPALLLERIGSVEALRRSFRLVRDRWWPTAGALIVGYLLIAIIGALVQGVITIVPSVLADGNTLVSALGAVVGGTIGSVLTTPYSAAVVALVYFDLRVRKEGLDLRLIAVGAGVERDPDEPLPAPLLADVYTPEERAQAPYWPPPPGWQPPSRAPAPREEASGWHPPQRDATTSADDASDRRPPERDAAASRGKAGSSDWRVPERDAPAQSSGWLPPRAAEPPAGDEPPDASPGSSGG